MVSGQVARGRVRAGEGCPGKADSPGAAGNGVTCYSPRCARPLLGQIIAERKRLKANMTDPEDAASGDDETSLTPMYR